jgi:multidrug efflux pump subunit AcrB
MNLKLTEWAIRRRWLVTCSIALVVVGVGSYLSLGRSADPAFIFPAVGIALAVCLAAEEMIRLQNLSSFRRDERQS